jgi:hypothetical protein
MFEKLAVQSLSFKIISIVLFTCSFFNLPVHAEIISITYPNYELSTFIDAEGIISDNSENIHTKYNDSYSIYNNVKDPLNPYQTTQYRDNIMTSGGRLLTSKEFKPSSIEKVVTYTSKQLGHLVTNNQVLDITSSSYESDICNAEGYTLFNQTGNIETKINKPGIGEFFQYTVSPVNNEGKNTTLATVDTKLYFRNDIPKIETVWDLILFDILFYSEPGKISQNTILKDRTLSSGEVAFYNKKYSYENYGITNNTTRNHQDLCVFREWIMREDSGINF